MSNEHVIDAKVRADTSDFQKGMSDAERELAGAGEAFSKYGAEAEKASQQTKGFVETNRTHMESLGKDAMLMGAGVTAGLGLAAKAAISWESAWAGVTKTVDGSPEQMAALEKELRGLATTLPVTHEEIAGVAEAAGQLGVKREDIISFTKTMIDLGETTNLTADEAATSIAQISNVMGTTGNDVDNFGATLVALGNAGASTEKEILEMTTRLAGAGKLVGASESDVLALANAMASVGIEAQLGGGVMSRVMQRMYADVQDGGKGIENLAKVSGVSAKEFANAFETDPVRAVDMMIKGLGRVKDEGGNVVKTMDDLGIKGTEETGVILRLAGAGDLLTDSLKLGGDAWKSNTALAAEAAKRYETTESKIKVAWNGIVDAGIDAGAVLLPMIQGAAEAVVGMSKAFGDLPQPVQNGVVAVAAITGGALLLGGTLLTTIPKVYDAVKAFQALQLAAPRTTAVLGGLGKAAGIAAGAFVGFEIVKGVHNSMQTATASLEEFTQALLGLEKNSGSLDKIFADVGAKEFEGDIRNAGDALNKLINQDFNSAIESFGATNLGVDNGMAKLAGGITKADQALATAVGSGNMELAAKGFQSVAKSAADHRISLEQVGEKFPEYLDSLRQMASDQGYALGTTSGLTAEQELLNWALGQTPPAMQAAAAAAKPAAATIEKVGTAAEQSAEQADSLVESLLKVNNVNLSAADAQMGFDQAVADSAANLVNAGAGVDYLNETTGEFNQTAHDNLEMLNGIAAQGGKVAQTVYDQTGSYEDFRKSLEGSRRSLFEVAKAYYPTEKAAWAYVDSVLAIPPMMKTTVDITDNNTIEGVKGNLKLLHEAIQGTPDKTVIVKEPMSPEVRKGLEKLGYVVTNLPDGTIQVGEQGTDSTGKKIDNTAGKKRIATITAAAITAAADAALDYTARARSSEILQRIRQEILPVGDPKPPASIARRADGGPVFGPGTGTSDDIPAMLSNGEHVLTAAEVVKMGGHAAVERMRDLAKAGLLPKFAGGGAAERRQEALRYQTDARRGNGYRSVTESLSSAYSFADRLTALADSGNVSAAAIRNLYTAAGRGEAGLKSLHGRADRLSASLERATSKLGDLAQVRDSVKDNLAGGFSIGDAVKRGNIYGSASMADVRGSASDYLSRVRSFAGKLKALQRRGYSGAVVQEIADMGIVAGSEAADVLLKATTGEVKSLNKTKTAIDSASTAAGNYVTDAMYKGGVNAAAGLVKGLQSQEAAIEKQMLKIGLGMETALKRALGIRSPSKKAELIADNFTGTIVDRLAAGAGPVAKQAGVLGDAMDVTPSSGVRVARRELQYAAPAPAPVRTSETAAAPLSLDGYTLELNADATMGTFRRIASAAASGAVRAANDDLKRGRAR